MLEIVKKNNKEACHKFHLGKTGEYVPAHKLNKNIKGHFVHSVCMRLMVNMGYLFFFFFLPRFFSCKCKVHFFWPIGLPSESDIMS